MRRRQLRSRTAPAHARRAELTERVLLPPPTPVFVVTEYLDEPVPAKRARASIVVATVGAAETLDGAVTVIERRAFRVAAERGADVADVRLYAHGADQFLLCLPVSGIPQGIARYIIWSEHTPNSGSEQTPRN